MILIAGFGMLMVFGMPYLLENSKYLPISSIPNILYLIDVRATVDPEMRAEFEEKQKSSSANTLLAGAQPGANPLGNFDAAAWLAGAGTKKSSEERVVERGVSR